ncbi:MAG: YcaO-like family protein [Acetobacteraceae bacterium]|nr:YcaO-like family protein [Acetobacteraceae bacterium]
MADIEGVKHYHTGTHRTVDPQTTLARVMPLAPYMGITRVSVLTGLDVVGIPAAAAIRPNSRSIAVHQGKGVTLAAAKASAVMEAVETFHAENLQLNLRLASFAELAPNAVDPELLPRCAGAQESAERSLWVEARDLISGTRIWVPHELVSADFTYPQPVGAHLFQATTNGLASGNHGLEAVLHGLYEAIERDAIALWRAASNAVQDSRAVNLGTVDGPTSRLLMRLFADAGVILRIWDVTSDVDLPVFVCLAVSDDGVEPELGSGCHVDADVALARALTEAAQARLTRISGARDDFAAASYRPAVLAGRHEAARRWMSAPPRRSFAMARSVAGPTLRHDLDAALNRLASAGVTCVAHVDLTQPELGIPVARVIVPGLEGPWTRPGGEYSPGPRVRR